MASPLNEWTAKLFAGRWIAGTSPDDAIKAARRFNNRGMPVLINDLGEGYRDREKVKDTVSIYLQLLESINRGSVKASLSVKPSQLGLAIDDKLLRSEYESVVRKAKSLGIFVWLDMEEHSTVEDTIGLYQKYIRYGNTGICMQSYLRRSRGDVKNIVDVGGVIRLVKGAYIEPHDIAFGSRKEVTRHFSTLMDYLFVNSERFMIATHDLDMVGKARRLEVKHKKRIMFGMLKGIMNREAAGLADNGENMNIYVPFGPEWVAYSYRRLTEAGHTSLVLKSLMKRQGI